MTRAVKRRVCGRSIGFAEVGKQRRVLEWIDRLVPGLVVEWEQISEPLVEASYRRMIISALYIEECARKGTSVVLELGECARKGTSVVLELGGFGFG